LLFFIKKDVEFTNLKKINAEFNSIRKKKVNSVLIKKIRGRRIVRLRRVKKKSDL